MKKFVKVVAFAMAGLFAFTGCGEKSADTIKIGTIGPLSGAVAVYGVDCKNGIELAVEEINAAGGINGKMISLISDKLSSLSSRYRVSPQPKQCQCQRLSECRRK